MSGENPFLGPSFEQHESLPLSESEQEILDDPESQFPELQIDDKARPLPPEEEWGVPGTEEQE